MATSTVEDLFKKLKPIYGAKKMDALWYAYLSEDAEGKRDIEASLQALYSKCFNQTFDRDQVLLTPPPPEILAGEYPLGKALYNGKELGEFGLREDEWIQHVGIFGRSGAGKTNLVFKIIDNFLNRGKKFLIFDWKKNYRPLITHYEKEEILVFTVGRKVAPLPFNPLIIPPGTEISTWISKLVEVLAETFYVGEGVKFLLQTAFERVYKEHGVYDGPPQTWPTMLDVLRFLDTYPARGREINWMVSTLRTVKSLCSGEFGRAINVTSNVSVQDLLDKNVVLELDGLGSNEKSFFIEALLLWIHHFRLSQGERETFKSAIIIEEAHHILLKRDTFGSESVVDVVLREQRELGTAIILIDQSPSSIALSAIANTYTKICLALGARQDVVAASSFLLLDREQKEFLGRLEIGQAIVKLHGRSFNPFLIKIPLCAIKNRYVSDDCVRERMAGYSGYSATILTAGPASSEVQSIPAGAKEEAGISGITEGELQLLQHIAEIPFSGVVKRYKGLNLSRRKGNQYKDGLTTKGYVRPVEIRTETGYTLLLEVTQEGKRELEAHGHKVKSLPGAGGVEHEYYRDKIIRYYTSLGFTTTSEDRLEGGHSVDVVAEKGNQRIAVEIETGESDFEHNIEADLEAEFDWILSVPTNTQAERKLQELVNEAKYGDTVRVVPGRLFKVKKAA